MSFTKGAYIAGSADKVSFLAISWILYFCSKRLEDCWTKDPNMTLWQHLSRMVLGIRYLRARLISQSSYPRCCELIVYYELEWSFIFLLYK